MINNSSMNDVPYDPCGHTKIAVSDFEKSRQFYRDLFGILGYKQVSDKEDRASWVSPDGYGILIGQARIVGYQYSFGAPGLHHVCLKASSTETVDQIYELILGKNVYVSGVPKKYPEFTEKYYAVYFADPDGIKLEVACY